MLRMLRLVVYAIRQMCDGLRILPWRLRFRMCGHSACWGIATHLTASERLLLYQLALRVRPSGVLLEVGSYLGASACCLAAGASEREGVFVHCVDTWGNEAMTEGTRDTFAEFLKNTESYGQWLVPHRGRSEDVSKSFDMKLDLLFIDGDHSYEGCKADAANWLPKVKAGGIVAFHDYAWSQGVQRVVKEWVMPIAVKQKAYRNLYVARLTKECDGVGL